MNMKKFVNWIFALVMVWLLELTVVHGSFSNLNSLWGSSFSLPRETACYGYPVHMRCPGTDVIEVVEAEYGRKNKVTCATSPEQMVDVECELPQAYQVTSSKCNNKTSCKLLVTSDNFPDPCPGTSKYLQLKYRCVKYMFSCPGNLMGIGTNTTFTTTMNPESGSWTRDPIYNPNHLFFIPSSQQSVQEYVSMETFVDGHGSPIIYNLPSQIEGTSFVISDRSIFYVQIHSRIIIKYSLRSRNRIKQSNLPGRYSPHLSQRLNRVTLAVDEVGLWAVYGGNSKSHQVRISRINKITLQAERTWQTTYPQSSTLHSFLICGVLYIVSDSTGEVAYAYNTNVVSGGGKSVSIGFDDSRPVETPTGQRQSRRISSGRMFLTPAGISSSKSRSFLTYNFTSIVYNPRYRLLYAWEPSSSRAISYNLHFGSRNPQLDQPTTTNPSISTTRSTTSTVAMVSTTSTTERIPPDELNRYCSSTSRSGYVWPRAEVGSTARLPCPGSEGKYVTWLCVRNEMTSQSHWDTNGPDMSQCTTWPGDIEFELNTDTLDAVNSAADQLLRHMLQMKDWSGGTIDRGVGLVKTIVGTAVNATPPLTLTQVTQLTRSLVKSVNIIVSHKFAWLDMDDIMRYRIIDTVLTSMEKTGLLLSNQLASSNIQYEETESAMESNIVIHPVAQPSTLPIDVASDNDHIHLSTMGLPLHDEVIPTVFVLYKTLGELIKAPLVGGDDHDRWEIDSKVVSVGIHPLEHPTQLRSPVRILLQTSSMTSQPRKCVYWKYSPSNGTGAWSDDGCRMTSSNRSYAECSCDHVTSFAVLVNVVGVEASDGSSLDILTSVGVSISLICLLLSFVTFCSFRNLQSDRNTIHKHLCASLFLAELIFLFGIKQTGHQVACAIIAGVLHYTFLTAFMWMALEGFQLYVMLVEVLESKSRWKWYYLVGYGIPLVIVGVSAAVGSGGYGGEKACWLKVDSGFIWSFVGPVCAVVLCNLIFLGITLTKMYRHTRRYDDLSKIDSIKTAVRGASILICLLGITWAFGILWLWEGTNVMAYLFCIFNAFQGFFIFIFHCLLPSKVRKEYSSLFARWKCCQKKSHNSYISSSLSFSKQYPPSHPTSVHPPTTQIHQVPYNNHRTNTSSATSHEMKSMINRDHHRVEMRPKKDRQYEPPRSEHHSANVTPPHNDGWYLHAQCHCNTDEPSDGEGAYDHLERHCHLNECNQFHHVGLRRNDGEIPFHPPQLQCRSQTINHLSSGQIPHQNVDNQVSSRGANKASTLMNVVRQEWDGRNCPMMLRPTPREGNLQTPPHHPSARNENSYFISSRPPHIQCGDVDHRKISHPGSQRRRSMTSSGSDDPIVNDLSTSSSTGSKPSSVVGTMSGHLVGMVNSVPHVRHQVDGERDETDLEVQRLTDLKEYDGRCDLHQRDSAFYQSFPDVNNSSLNMYSSHSGHSEGETPQVVHPHQTFCNMVDNASASSSRYSDPQYTSHSHESCDTPRANDSHVPLMIGCRPVMQSRDTTNQYELNSPDRMMTCL